MNKTELIKAMAAKADVTKKDAEACLSAFMDSVKETLKNGDSVQLMGFGTFGVSERAARIGRNPRTGETMEIAASKVPTFKAGHGLKDALK